MKMSRNGSIYFTPSRSHYYCDSLSTQAIHKLEIKCFNIEYFGHVLYFAKSMWVGFGKISTNGMKMYTDIKILRGVKFRSY